jgi:dienelactone hydrolase
VIPSTPVPVPRITVLPDAPAVDTPLEILLESFPPGAEVIVRTGMRDLFGKRWAARATFVVDGDGCVDLATRAPVGGSYRNADPMGLIWSMAEDIGGGISRPAGPEPLPAAALTITAQVEGLPVIEMVVDRLRLPVGVERTDVREHGLVATLFWPREGGSRPGVILLAESGGGLPEVDAALLAGDGFAVLALAYFGMEELPPALVDVPLEYFATAVSFMQAHPAVGGDRLAVMGGSRGGEAALLAGATDPRVRAVVSTVGSGVMRQGIPPGDTLLELLTNRVPAWSQHGRSLPFLPSSVPPELAEQLASGEPVELALALLEGLGDADAVAAATIPVERIHGPVLLVSAGKDKAWPSVALNEIALERLRRSGHRWPVEHLVYEAAGHAIVPPPYGPATELVFAGPSVEGGPGVALATGGTPEANAAARADVWVRIREFLTEHLAG